MCDTALSTRSRLNCRLINANKYRVLLIVILTRLLSFYMLFILSIYIFICIIRDHSSIEYNFFNGCFFNARIECEYSAYHEIKVGSMKTSPCYVQIRIKTFPATFWLAKSQSPARGFNSRCSGLTWANFSLDLWLSSSFHWINSNVEALARESISRVGRRRWFIDNRCMRSFGEVHLLPLPSTSLHALFLLLAL